MEYIKGVNSLAEVKKAIKEHGNFRWGLKGWRRVMVSKDCITVETKKDFITYKNVYGTFSFPTYHH